MPKTFAALKSEALAATNEVELYKVYVESATKLQKNVSAVQFMSYMPGRAAEADFYFEQVIPAWEVKHKEILAMVEKSFEGKTAKEVVTIISEALA